MEEKKVQRDLIDESEFAEYLSSHLFLAYYAAVGKFKSVKRAIKRGNVSREGIIYPSRPFNNRKNTCKRNKQSRKLNEEKKNIYANIKEFRDYYAE